MSKNNYTIKKNSSYGDGGFVIVNKKTKQVIKKVKNRKQARDFVKEITEEREK
jgi:hypothetical protein